VNFSIETDDIDKLVSNLEKANINLLCPLEERWYKKTIWSMEKSTL
jgi:hypothetical protein